MKKFVIIQGAQASGKMTVGEELEKITGLKLFHNHKSIEVAYDIFGFCDDRNFSEEQNAGHKLLFNGIRDTIRAVVFSSIAKSHFDGLITTGVMDFDSEASWNTVHTFIKSFADSARENGEETVVYCVELVCGLEERLRRNQTANRLEKKPSKRNIEWTQQDILRYSKERRMESNEQDRQRFPADRYLVIDNSNLAAEAVAKMIKAELGL